MRSEIRWTTLGCAAALMLVLAGAPTLAQEPPSPPEPVTPIKPLPVMPGEGEGEDTPLKILERISKTLREVESKMARLTFDGGVGEGQTRVIDDIEKLLEDAGGEQKSVLNDIDKLLDMAEQQCKSGNFTSQSMSQSQKQQQQQQQQQQQKQNQDQDKKSRLDPQNQEKNGGEPDSPQKSEGDPNKTSKPNDPAAEKTWNKDIHGRWGSLPPKLQELIRQGDPSKFPPQYREMLEEYYKRLSDKDT